MEKKYHPNNNIMKINDFSSLNLNNKNVVNKILLLNSTHNLVCSFGEKAEIFSLNFEKKQENKDIKKVNSLQEILDPHFYSIEYLLETKQNSNNKNYLLLCSDMIHVFFLYDNDTKSNLLHSVNEFNFRYIYQVIELRNGNLISYSNEYKISVFSNLLIKNEEIVETKDYIKYKKEIYELEENKLNKDNETIMYILELYPDKFVYCYRIDYGEFTPPHNDNDDNENDDNNDNDNDNEIKDEKNINNNNQDYIYIKFMNKKYNIITEMIIAEITKDVYSMFQYSENIMAVINTSYLTLIDLNHYEIISKIKTNLINLSYFFSNTYIKNNYINYLVLIVNNLKDSSTENDESENKNDNENNENNNNEHDGSFSNDDNFLDFISEEEEYIINFYDLTNLVYGLKLIKIFDINNTEINLNELLSPDNILEISITNDNSDKNSFYLCIYNKKLEIIYTKFKIVDKIK